MRRIDHPQHPDWAIIARAAGEQEWTFGWHEVCPVFEFALGPDHAPDWGREARFVDMERTEDSRVVRDTLRTEWRQIAQLGLGSKIPLKTWGIEIEIVDDVEVDPAVEIVIERLIGEPRHDGGLA